MFGLILGKDNFGFMERSFLRVINPRKRDWILTKVRKIMGFVFIMLSIFYFFLLIFFEKLYIFIFYQFLSLFDYLIRLNHFLVKYNHTPFFNLK